MGKRLLTVSAVLLACLFFTAQISALGVKEGNGGSGVIETRSFDLTGYDKIVLSGVTDFEISQSNTYGVMVMSDDNVIGDVQVVRSGRRLDVSLLGNHKPTQLKVNITTPDISRLVLSAGSRGILNGFNTQRDVVFELSQKSDLELTGLSSAALDIMMSGRSTINGMIDADLVTYHLSHSDLSLNGHSDELVGVSRNGSVNLNDFSVELADMDFRDESSGTASFNGDFGNSRFIVRLEGSSDLTIDSEGTVFADVFDDSELYYSGYATVQFKSDEATVEEVYM